MKILPACVRATVLAGLALGYGLAAAEEPAQPRSNPSLFAEQNGIDDASRRRPLKLARLALDVTIEGSIAATTLTATLAGNRREVLEGHFALALPDGAVVHGYALDIKGRMVDGSLVTRPKARAVYDSKVRVRIDPGVASVSPANVFTTNVYPIFPEGERTIRIAFAMPLHRGLTLPLTTDDTVGDVSIKLTARNVDAPPPIEWPAGLAAQWRRTRAGYEAVASATDTSLSGALALAPTTPKRTALVTWDRAGESFFQIRDAHRALAPRPYLPNRVRVYWDASLSRRDDGLDEERSLLERYLSATAGASVDLVVFNSTTAHVTPDITLDRLRSELDALDYRGGTSFAVVDSVRLPDADVCLLFSDGAATIDRRDTFDPDCTLKAITSAADADRGYLAQLTRASGGVIVRLGAESPEVALNRLLNAAPVLVSATSIEGRPLGFTIVEQDETGWFVIGQAPRTGDVVLHFKERRGRTSERRYSVASARASRFDGVGPLWAADRIAALSLADARLDAVERVARRYSVSSPKLSYIVLETPVDYAAADIELPHGYPADARRDYLRARADIEAYRSQTREHYLARLHEAWYERKQWWSREDHPSNTQATYSTKWQRDVRRRRAPASSNAIRNESVIEEVIVTGMYIEPMFMESALPMAVTTFGTEPMNQGTPGQAPARPRAPKLGSTVDPRVETVATEQDPEQSPAYYLEAADGLYRNDAVAEASEMLLSALELPASNEETKSIVAERLLRYGYLDRAIWLLEQAAELSNHRPQPKMQLAHALATRAAVRTMTAKRDLQRAIELLNEVATTPWGSDYPGIALSALMEANALIPRLNRAGGTRVALDPELVALLDLDIRVVIDWNTAATDLDLLVDEPNGERAFYRRRLTSNGGLLSSDVTNGYGPEEYLLRRAGPGEYRVHVDLFATDTIDPNGVTNVTARLIHDFGRPTQREESIDIELSPDHVGERLVGSIRVGGGE